MKKKILLTILFFGGLISILVLTEANNYFGAKTDLAVPYNEIISHQEFKKCLRPDNKNNCQAYSDEISVVYTFGIEPEKNSYKGMKEVERLRNANLEVYASSSGAYVAKQYFGHIYIEKGGKFLAIKEATTTKENFDKNKPIAFRLFKQAKADTSNSASTKNNYIRNVAGAAVNYSPSLTTYFENDVETGRALIRGSLASGSGTISTVKLFLKVAGVYTSGGTVDAYQILRNTGAENSITWNLYDGSNSWATAGAMGSGDYTAAVIDAVITPAVNNWQSWVLTGSGGSGTPISFTWGSDVSLLLKQQTESGATHGSYYYLRNDGTSGNQPYFEITYTPDAAAESVQIIIIE